MAEYRPDAKDLWQKIKGNLPLVRRGALALGGALFAFGLTRSLGARFEFTAYASVGGAILGFFAPRFIDGQ
jgi:hypothetical protein